MNPNINYVGLDVSKEKIAVAVAEEGRSQPRYLGVIPYREKSLGKLVDRWEIRNSCGSAMKRGSPAMAFTAG
ncbi:hypothetical protein OYT88_05525 [Sporolactobacillus sp. CQH2019]|uniref:hypothetical protein n=1 Tax=Sporolactobacillus sp. CQH2019 TaxID=3023512 RepID=UPI002368CE78|nr:hypothetical protein [Sporolactobacillus sp. CQH2019]MDD9148007.1 hypothetical protein [Sporolactobacillus sp. CQH2019]